MTEHAFHTDRPVRLLVEIEKGEVHVHAEDRGDAQVVVEGARADDVQVTWSDDELRVVGPRGQSGFFSGDQQLHVTVRVPTDSSLEARTGSADVTAEGRWGEVGVRTGSGDVQLAEVAAADLQTGSGDVHLQHAGGDVTGKSGSGDLRLDRVDGSLGVSTGSGDIVIGTSNGAVTAKTGSGDLKLGASGTEVSMATGSGDLEVGSATRGRITLKGASGDVRVGIPAGVPVWTDLKTISGRLTSTLAATGAPAEGQDHVELRLTTVSGDITLLER